MLYGDFGVAKKNNIFGHGLVGGTLINQILESAASIENEKILNSMFFAIANSKKVLLNKTELRTGKKVRY
jgi:aspartokinase/homoserine dehydrogenase 1